MSEQAPPNEQTAQASGPEAAREQPRSKEFYKSLFRAAQISRDLNVYGYVEYPFRSTPAKDGGVTPESYSRESQLWLDGQHSYQFSERRIRAACRQDGIRDERAIQSRIEAEIEIEPWAKILLELHGPNDYLRFRDLVKLWPRLVRRAKDLMAPLPKFKPTVIGSLTADDFMSSESVLRSFDEHRRESSELPLHRDQVEKLHLIEQCLSVVLEWKNPRVVSPTSATCLSDIHRLTIEQVISEIRRILSATPAESILELTKPQPESDEVEAALPAYEPWRLRRQIPSWFRSRVS